MRSWREKKVCVPAKAGVIADLIYVMHPILCLRRRSYDGFSYRESFDPSSHLSRYTNLPETKLH